MVVALDYEARLLAEAIHLFEIADDFAGGVRAIPPWHGVGDRLWGAAVVLGFERMHVGAGLRLSTSRARAHLLRPCGGFSASS